MFCGSKVGADQSLGRGSFLDLCDQGEPIARLRLESGTEATRRALLARKPVEVVHSRKAAPFGHLDALRRADFVELVHWARSIQRARSASARPESSASAACVAPSA